MTFHNINNNQSNMTGRFGSGHARNVRENRPAAQGRGINLKNLQISNLGNITAERWVDIICISIISIFLISVFINWNAFLDLFFVSVLFPIISVGAKLLGTLIGIGAVIGYIYAKIRRPRRWY